MSDQLKHKQIEFTPRDIIRAIDKDRHPDTYKKSLAIFICILYYSQTDTEKIRRETTVKNDVGFSKPEVSTGTKIAMLTLPDEKGKPTRDIPAGTIKRNDGKPTNETYEEWAIKAIHRHDDMLARIANGIHAEQRMKYKKRCIDDTTCEPEKNQLKMHDNFREENNKAKKELDSMLAELKGSK